MREDGREGDVFSLIGPKKYDVPWRELETQGWIAEATLHRNPRRLAESTSASMEYAVAEWRDKYRLASENPAKDDVVERLLDRYQHEQRVLIIGQYLKQLRQLGRAIRIAADHRRRPATPSARICTASSARGEVRHLILSKVGNFAIDLPDANVLIQVSGTFGSRQEEAQRLGRILRPKPNGETAHFYTLVTRDTRERISPTTASCS